LVAGSHHHLTPESERRHRAPIFFASGAEGKQDKLSCGRWARGDSADIWQEDVATQPPILHIHYCADASVTAVIGNDLLDPTVERLLRSLRVGCILVPASAVDPVELDALADSGGRIASSGAAVVVASTPPSAVFVCASGTAQAPVGA